MKCFPAALAWIYCCSKNFTAFRHITLDSCHLCQVSQLYVTADSIEWGWQECLVMGWDHSVLLLEWFALYFGTNPVSVCLRILTNQSQELVAGLWLASLSFLVNKSYIVWLKHTRFYSELDRLFPTSTFSPDDVFPGLDRNSVLICGSMVIIYKPAKRWVRFMSSGHSLLLLNSCPASGRAWASRGYWLMLEDAAACFVDGYKYM